MTAWAVTLLPQPDSPTSPTVLPRGTEKLTSVDHAEPVFRSVLNATVRSVNPQQRLVGHSKTRRGK